MSQSGGRGTLILVAGPSGAGKDTLIQGARRALSDDPAFCFPRRYITRPPEPAGENHVPISDADYEAMAAAGGFCLHWEAHGLSYGLPPAVDEELTAGRHVVANVSRGVIGEAQKRLAPVQVVLVEASPELLARRLAKRGRETDAQQRQRLAREAAGVTQGDCVTRFNNAAAVDEEIAHFTALLRELVAPSGRVTAAKTGMTG